MKPTSREIRISLESVRRNLQTEFLALEKDSVLLTRYSDLVRITEEGEIWTEAFRKALKEHHTVLVPARKEPYYIDDTVIIPSCRLIKAMGAVVQLTADCKVIMFRNEHTLDGTHAPISPQETDRLIGFMGGRYAESNTQRLGYGRTGLYDRDRSFYGVSTCFFFDNMEGLWIGDVTFYHTAGFSVQTGDLKNACFEHIFFDACFADGLHLNGNSENLLIRDLKGQVGDDLVALNMYDWQNSSVNFGPTRNVLCEKLDMFPSSRYKALRIEPGTYYYDDGSEVDCGLYDAVFSEIRGVETFKLYFQTPPYKIGEQPEKGEIGSVDNLFFEKITVDLLEPIDHWDDFIQSDPIRGHFAAFEFGAKGGKVTLKDIELTLYPDKWPLSHLLYVGPKSVSWPGEREVFDPYLSSGVEELALEKISVNGRTIDEVGNLLHIAHFEDVNRDGHSTGHGHLGSLTLDGKKIEL